MNILFVQRYDIYINGEYKDIVLGWMGDIKPTSSQRPIFILIPSRPKRFEWMKSLKEGDKLLIRKKFLLRSYRGSTCSNEFQFSFKNQIELEYLNETPFVKKLIIYSVDDKSIQDNA